MTVLLCADSVVPKDQRGLARECGKADFPQAQLNKLWKEVENEIAAAEVALTMQEEYNWEGSDSSGPELSRVPCDEVLYEALLTGVAEPMALGLPSLLGCLSSLNQGPTYPARRIGESLV